MTLIVDAFEGPESALSLDDVSGRTGLPRSTAHRIMQQMAALAWIEVSPHGFRLGPRLVPDRD